MTAIPAFAFATAGEIVFGRGRASEAPARIAAMGRRVLLVHGRDPGRAAWLADGLRAEGAEVTALACPREPDLTLVEEAAALARGCDAVAALGGGAAIDLGKAAAALATQSGGPLDHLEVVGRGLPLDRQPLPFAALPTTAGTGAEVTRNAVIGAPEQGRKASLRDRRMLPALALVDPALTDGCPKAVTLASGLDAVTQVVEPYLSNRATPLTDALCRDAIPRGLAALRRLMEGEDPDARDEMAWVSLAGGLALANSGLGAVHGLAGVIGGRTGAAHGEICGRLLPVSLMLNARRAEGETARRLAEVRGWIGRAFGIEDDGAIETLAAWSASHGLRGLRDMGLDPADHAGVAEAAQGSSSMKGNPVALRVEELAAMLDAAS